MYKYLMCKIFVMIQIIKYCKQMNNSFLLYITYSYTLKNILARFYAL